MRLPHDPVFSVCVDLLFVTVRSESHEYRDRNCSIAAKSSDSQNDQSPSTTIGITAAVLFPLGEGAQYWNRGLYGGFTLLAPLSSQHTIGLHLGIGKLGINKGEMTSELVKLTGALPSKQLPNLKISGSIREFQAYVLFRQNSLAFQSASSALFLQFLAGLVSIDAEAKLSATIKNEFISVSDTESETVACVGAGIGIRIGNDQTHIPLEILPLYQLFFDDEESSQFSLSLQVFF